MSVSVLNGVYALMKVIHQVCLSSLLCKDVTRCHIGYQEHPLDTKSAGTFTLWLQPLEL